MKSCLTYAVKIDGENLLVQSFFCSVSQLVLMGFEEDSSSSFGVFKCRLFAVLAHSDFCCAMIDWPEVTSST